MLYYRFESYRYRESKHTCCICLRKHCYKVMLLTCILVIMSVWKMSHYVYKFPTLYHCSQSIMLCGFIYKRIRLSVAVQYVFTQRFLFCLTISICVSAKESLVSFRALLKPLSYSEFNSGCLNLLTPTEFLLTLI